MLCLHHVSMSQTIIIWPILIPQMLSWLLERLGSETTALAAAKGMQQIAKTSPGLLSVAGRCLGGLRQSGLS